MLIEKDYPAGAVRFQHLMDIFCQVCEEQVTIKLYNVVPTTLEIIERELTNKCVISNEWIFFKGADGPRESLLDNNIFENDYNDNFFFDNPFTAQRYLEKVKANREHQQDRMDFMNLFNLKGK